MSARRCRRRCCAASSSRRPLYCACLSSTKRMRSSCSARRAFSISIFRSGPCAARRAEIRFDKLLIATGANPRRLGVPGEQLGDIHYLRTLDDALGLRAKLSSHPRVLVVGTGFIGCEVAASARQIGAR